nr:uncharacterized mitochondrial protein AtMg00810-like [Tanacetum cinerariifolium]
METHMPDIHNSRKCMPLTRIATTTIVPSRDPIPIVNNTDKPVVTLVYSRKTKAANKKVPVCNSTISKPLVGNKLESNNSWGSSSSNVHSLLINCRLSKLSSGQFCDSDLEVAFRQHTCFIRNLDRVDLLIGSRGNNLYTLSLQDMIPSSPICLLVWLEDYRSLNLKKITFVQHVQWARVPRTHKPKSEDTNQKKLYLLHMDLCGPMRIESVNGKKYILVIIDDYSRFTWVKFLRSKDETSYFIIKFLKMIQVRLKVPVRRIRTNNGTEFVNQTLHDYYEEVGISHETSVARSPQQNRVVERRNCTLIKEAHTIENLGKLQPKADIGIFIGYAPTKKAFRIYNRRTRRIVETIHVDFDELTVLAFEQSSLGPTLNEMTPGIISLGLVQKSSPLTSFVPPSRNDWDLLFQPMFDELLNPLPCVVNQAPEVIAPITTVIPPIHADSIGSPFSTPVDQDAPSLSKTHTTTEIQSSVIHQDVGDDNLDMEVAHMRNDSLFDVHIPEVTSTQSSSTASSQLIVQTNHPILHHNNKWMKDHPLNNIIVQLSRPVSTRLQLYEQALFCYYDAFLTSVEPMMYKEVLTQSCWSEAMQEELNEFERLEVWELVPRPDKVMISQSPRGIFINQSKYALESLKKYGFESCDPVDTPMVEKSKLDEDREGKAVDPSHYRGMIEILLYLTASIPDLQFAICMCARYQARPTEKHVHAVKRIFRYLRGIVNQGLWYLKDSSVALTAFADADHAGCQDTRRSTSGSVQFLGERLISWSSKRQKSVAISSTEAEYIALSGYFVYQVEHENHKKSNEMYYPRFTKVIIHHFMSKDKSILRINKINWHYVRDDFIFLTIKVVSRHQNSQQYGAMLPIELTNDEIRNTKAYKEYYAFATGEAAPKLKASARRKMSGSDTSITPPTATTTPKPTVTVTPKLTAAAKGKQPAKSLFAPSEVSNDDEEDEGNDREEREEDDDEEEKDGDERDDDDENQEITKDDEQDDTERRGDDTEEGESDEDDDDEETRDVENSNPIPHTPESSEDEGNGEDNQGRGLEVTQVVEDSHVTLTLINFDGQQESSLVSSQFVTNMLNPTSDAGMESIFATASTFVAPLPITAPTMTLSTITTIITTSQALILPTPILSEVLQNLPIFDSVFCFDDRLRSLEQKFFEVMQTTQFAGAVSAILIIVQHFMDQRMNEAVQVAIRLQSDRLREEAQKENDDFLRTAVNGQLEAEVLTRSSHSSRTSYAVAADLSEIELKKILIKKMEANKSIQCSDAQRNLYKALVDAFESDKINLDTYGETVTLKRRRDNDEEKDKEPSARPNRGSKRCREGKEPESGSTLSEPATKSAGRLPLRWKNPYTRSLKQESARDVYSKRRIIVVTNLKIMEWHSYKHLGKLTNLTVEEHFSFNVSFRMFTRSIVIQRRVEDLQLRVESYQKKLNLTNPDTYRSDLKQKEAYTAYSNQRGFIYKNKDKKNRLMWIDELHKFSDGTLNDVRTALDDRLKGIRMQYLP